MYLPNNTDLQQAREISKPTTLDYLRPASFRFEIYSLPHASYTCQVANIPSVTIGSAKQPAPKRDIPVPGDKAVFSDLNIRFMVNEDMSNYTEIFNWLMDTVKIDSEYQVDIFRKATTNFPLPNNKAGGSGVHYSDASLFIIDSNNNAIAKVNYYNIIPVSLESLDFDITNTSQEPVIASATFEYTHYDIEPL